MADKQNGAPGSSPVAEPAPVNPAEGASDAAPSWFEQSVDRTRRWIHDNPMTAVALAVGAGLLVGRLVARAGAPHPPPPPPPTRLERLRDRAGDIALQTRGHLEDFGHQVAGRTAHTRAAAQAVLGRAGDSLSQVPSVGADLLARIGEAVQLGVSKGVSRKVAEWVEHVQHRAGNGAR